MEIIRPSYLSHRFDEKTKWSFIYQSIFITWRDYVYYYYFYYFSHDILEGKRALELDLSKGPISAHSQAIWSYGRQCWHFSELCFCPLRGMIWLSPHVNVCDVVGQLGGEQRISAIRESVIVFREFKNNKTKVVFFFFFFSKDHHVQQY